MSSFTSYNETITDPDKIAGIFASHFQDNFTVDQSVFDPNDIIDSCHDHSGMSLFCSMCTDGAEVSEILSKLKISKSTGPDGISSRLLKLASPAVANTLARIFNISIESETFPEEWKKANVVQIYKKGAKEMILETTDPFLWALLLVKSWRELLPKDYSYIFVCMVWLQKVNMAFVKEDHVLPNWLPCIMSGLLFLISSLHRELMLCSSTGLKHLTRLVTVCFCSNFTDMAYAVKC